MILPLLTLICCNFGSRVRYLPAACKLQLTSVSEWTTPNVSRTMLGCRINGVDKVVLRLAADLVQQGPSQGPFAWDFAHGS